MSGMSTPESQSESPNPPNSSGEPIRKRRSPVVTKPSDFPSFVQQEKNPLAQTPHKLNDRGMALKRLGLTEQDVKDVPSITWRVREAVGTVREAVGVLSGDDAADSLKFCSTWNAITAKDHKHLKLEDIITASGITTRRFMELLAGASLDHSEFVFKTISSSKKAKVLQSVVKAATDEVPIVVTDEDTGTTEVVGYENADVKAMELFFKLTGDIKPSGGVVVNSNNQTANITAPERAPLQSMDSWLLEIDDIRKPRQLNAPPVIPVEIPENAPEIEYMPLGDE